MTLAIISHPDCLLHEMGQNHPEQPARLKAIEEALQNSSLNRLVKHYEAPLASREQLLRVHPANYIDELFHLSPRQGFVQIDPDTTMNPYTLQAALRAAGAGAFGVDLVMSRKAGQVFCNVRPPGHHAEKNQAMGFCFFNNVAVAIMQALEQHGLSRVALVDFDVHHGNGSEDIFKEEKRVLFCSSFQHPFYPYSGADTRSEYQINLPLEAGTSGKLWREEVKVNFLEALKKFEPQLIFFSAGFDAYVNDPLANLMLVEEDYFWLTQQVLEWTERSAERRAVSVLEGGYDLDGLGRCALAHLNALQGSK